MTLPSRHRILNSSSGYLRLNMLPLGHGGSSQYWIFTSERGRNILSLWNLEARVVFEPAISDFPSFNHCTSLLLSPFAQSSHSIFICEIITNSYSIHHHQWLWQQSDFYCIMCYCKSHVFYRNTYEVTYEGWAIKISVNVVWFDVAIGCIIMAHLCRCGDMLVYLWPLSLSVCLCLWVSHSFKHATLTQCWTNVGPPSTTLTQH